jgi:hypothetical protein
MGLDPLNSATERFPPKAEIGLFFVAIFKFVSADYCRGFEERIRPEPARAETISLD